MGGGARGRTRRARPQREQREHQRHEHPHAPQSLERGLAHRGNAREKARTVPRFEGRTHRRVVPAQALGELERPSVHHVELKLRRLAVVLIDAE
jgi:hypothetical protein